MTASFLECDWNKRIIAYMLRLFQSFSDIRMTFIVFLVIASLRWADLKTKKIDFISFIVERVIVDGTPINDYKMRVIGNDGKKHFTIL